MTTEETMTLSHQVVTYVRRLSALGWDATTHDVADAFPTLKAPHVHVLLSQAHLRGHITRVSQGVYRG